MLRRLQSPSQRAQKGAATVETIIVVPALFLLVFTVLEFTNILRVYHAVVWVAEYGVREASGGMVDEITHERLTASEVKDEIEAKLKGLGVQSVNRNAICIQYSNDDGSTWIPPIPEDEDSEMPDCSVDLSDSSDYERGDLVRVEINLAYVPFLDNLLVPDLIFRSTFERVISK